jgi:hypothetical protein
LATRRDELRRLAQDAQDAVRRRDLLQSGSVQFVLNAAPVQQAATLVAGARKRFGDDPGFLAQPNPIDLPRVAQVLRAVRQTLADAWSRHVNAPADDQLPRTLEAVPRFAGAAAQLHRVYDELRRLAERLPANADALRMPDRLRTRAQEVIRSLNLGENVLNLIDRAQRGRLTLAELLAEPELLNDLRTHHILECLRVVI